MRGFRRLDGLLGSAVGSPGILKTARAQIAMQRWPEVVGPGLADKAAPDRYDKGTLWVVSHGSAWSQEIRMRKEEIVRRLNEIADEPGLFTDLRVGTRAHRIKE